MTRVQYEPDEDKVRRVYRATAGEHAGDHAPGRISVVALGGIDEDEYLRCSACECIGTIPPAMRYGEWEAQQGR